MKKLSGQALLLLIVLGAMATTITAGAVSTTIINSQTTSKYTIGEEALSVAEAGVENAIMRLLRNPKYNPMTIPTLTVGNGSANVTVSGPINNINIRSIGTIGNFMRKVEVSGDYSNNEFVISSWIQVD